MEKVKERTAFGLDFKQFCHIEMKINSAHDVFKKEHPIREHESFSMFLKKGSESLKNNQMIRGKLL